MNYAHALPRRTTRTIAFSLEKIEKKILFALIITISFFVLAYLGLIAKTMWNIVEMQNLSQAVKQSSSDVAVLESSYMTLSSNLTIDHAYALGFQDVKSSDTTFVERPVTSVALR